MELLTIYEADADTARAMLAALHDFRPALFETSEGCEILVTVDRSDRGVMEVLTALERYVADRDGPVRVELDGRSYVIRPAGESDGIVDSFHDAA
jgi:hypothetical protein